MHTIRISNSKGEILVEKNNKDYIYCKDCEEYSDFYNYNHNIDDAGHKGHKWRYVTDNELKTCFADCIIDGCFRGIK
jgi:hypothetical protein